MPCPDCERLQARLDKLDARLKRRGDAVVFLRARGERVERERIVLRARLAKLGDHGFLDDLDRAKGERL